MTSLVSDLPSLLQQYDERTRQEAERLVDDDAVIGLELLEDEMMAEVRLDDRPAQVRWLRGEHGWHGETDVDDDRGAGNLALCATLVAVQRREARGTLPLPPVEEEDFEHHLTTKLARPLTPDEENYLSKMEKRYERVRLTGKIFDQDMVRLHPKWAIQSMEPVALWPEAPKTCASSGTTSPSRSRTKACPRLSCAAWRTSTARARRCVTGVMPARCRPGGNASVSSSTHARKLTPRTMTATRQCEFRLLITVNDVRLQISLEGETPSPSRRWMPRCSTRCARSIVTVTS
jgi:hypothetical protein